jgi:hypothetical protein
MSRCLRMWEARLRRSLSCSGKDSLSADRSLLCFSVNVNDGDEDSVGGSSDGVDAGVDAAELLLDESDSNAGWDD